MSVQRASERDCAQSQCRNMSTNDQARSGQDSVKSPQQEPFQFEVPISVDLSGTDCSNVTAPAMPLEFSWLNTNWNDLVPPYGILAGEDRPFQGLLMETC